MNETSDSFEAGLCEELSRLVGQPVEIVRRTYGADASWFFVVPEDRRQLKSAFWRAVKQSDSGGAWPSAAEAVVRFAAGWKEWSQTCATSPGLARELAQQLANGPRAAADLQRHFAGLGASIHQLGRVSRRLGVQKRKTGLRSGWLWQLPASEPNKPSL